MIRGSILRVGPRGVPNEIWVISMCWVLGQVLCHSRIGKSRRDGKIPTRKFLHPKLPKIQDLDPGGPREVGGASGVACIADLAKIFNGFRKVHISQKIVRCSSKVETA